MSARICGIVSVCKLAPSGRASTYTLLEGRDLVVGEGVRLGDDWDEVDLGVQAAHDLDIERLQRVAGRLNEVHAGMHAVVDDVHAVDLVLRVEVGVETLLDVLDNRSPGVVVVDEVTEAGSVNDGQAEAHAVLLDVCGDGLYADRLWCEIERRLFSLLRRV